jgi:hypothetical protein
MSLGGVYSRAKTQKKQEILNTEMVESRIKKFFLK